MKERPILFSGPMVRAILEGRKTQTRRIVKPQPPCGCFYAMNGAGDHALCFKEGGDGKGGLWCVPPTPKSHDHRLRSRYGQPGDRLWVRETWHPHKSHDGPASYRATWPRDDEPPDEGWRTSIHMPRWVSRITLEVLAVRVERLHDITEEDAKAEGVEPYAPDDGRYRDGFKDLWQSNNGPGSWDTNPWVWVIEFKRVEEKR